MHLSSRFMLLICTCRTVAEAGSRITISCGNIPVSIQNSLVSGEMQLDGGNSSSWHELNSTCAPPALVARIDMPVLRS